MDRVLVAKVGEVEEGRCHLVKLRGMEIALFLVGGEYRAYRNVCPHAGAPLDRGRISGTTLHSAVYQYEYGMERQILRCPWHGWEFDLKTGAHLVDSGCKLRSYHVTVEDGLVYVTV